jgi:hypothetical protein
MKKLESLLRALATLTMIFIGLIVVGMIFLWPGILVLFLLNTSIISSPFLLAFVALFGHNALLIYVDHPYLYVHRLMFLPIRMVLMPLLNKIIENEATQEKATVWYNDCSIFVDDNSQACLQTMLSKMKSSSRKDIKQKLRLYHSHGITTTTIHSNYLSLQKDIPILWKHQKRQCEREGKVVLEEFLKRFLVIFLVSNAYIDRYYSGHRLCAIGMFTTSGPTFVHNMYFSIQPNYGIWQYHHIRGLYRAISAYQLNEKIRFINYYHHQDNAKKLAGSQPLDLHGSCADEELRYQLFPLKFYKEPPTSVINIQLNLSTIQIQRHQQPLKKTKVKVS